jgi:hypothetical protein
MPSVFVVPVYVEVPSGFERSVMALESHLRRAGYVFHTGNPLHETLEQTKKALLRPAAVNEDQPPSATPLAVAESNKA